MAAEDPNSERFQDIKRMLYGIELTILGIGVGGGAVLYELPAIFYLSIPLVLVGFVRTVLGYVGSDL